MEYMKQLNHYEFKKNQKVFKPNIIVILENFDHEENIGSAFRLADAFNIQKIIIVTSCNLNFKKIEKTARSCVSYIPYEFTPSIDDAINYVKQNDFTPIAIEICDESISLRQCDFSKFEGVALIVGNESHGVSQTALDKCYKCVHIDMYGNNSSMNVSTALAIALYKCCEDYLKSSI